MQPCQASKCEHFAQREVPTDFEALLPSIRRIVRFAFRRVQVTHRQELIAAAVARAYEMYARLVERGKASLAYATALANYAIRQVRAGRGTGSKQNTRELLSLLTQRQKGFSVVSLTTEMLAEGRNADPAELAAIRIDFGAWLRGSANLKGGWHFSLHLVIARAKRR